MYAIAAYGVQCLADGCRGRVQGSRVCVQEEGCCTTQFKTKTFDFKTVYELRLQSCRV